MTCAPHMVESARFEVIRRSSRPPQVTALAPRFRTFQPPRKPVSAHVQRRETRQAQPSDTGRRTPAAAASQLAKS